MSKTIILFGTRKKLIDKTNNGGNVTSLKMIEVVQCNLVDNQYQQKSKVIYTFTPSKSYAYLLNVESSNLVFLYFYILFWPLRIKIVGR